MITYFESEIFLNKLFIKIEPSNKNLKAILINPTLKKILKIINQII
jgi:hypothetical protein